MTCRGGVPVRRRRFAASSFPALLLLAFVIAAGLPACSSIEHMSDPGPEELEREADAFTKYFRWKQYAKAKLFVLPERERAFTKFTRKIESNLDISDFSVEEVS